jgi:hypothetical protein
MLMRPSRLPQLARHALAGLSILTIGLGSVVVSAPAARASHDSYCGHGTGPERSHAAFYLRRNAFVLHYNNPPHVHRYREEQTLSFPRSWAETGRVFDKVCS